MSLYVFFIPMMCLMVFFVIEIGREQGNLNGLMKTTEGSRHLGRLTRKFGSIMLGVVVLAACMILFSK